jgi:alkanesulfonate monooxygenase SsuD/methylene tetrahydromethanopterin reductase-like flavin-dependent oxidoreductase (luciferase family)
MKYGFVLPRGDAKTAADLAYEAEKNGWDGFFVWEPVWGIDAWVSLAAAAMLTNRIRLGTMITPISRMRPWKLASETATLDNLSNGRLILSVGLGALYTGFESFGEISDRKTRAELMDEGLEIVTGLWKGQPVNFTGKHYQIHETSFLPPPPPLQKPRIPIWVVGAWPSQKSMQRAMRFDGILPAIMDEKTKSVRMSPAEPEEIKQIKLWIDSNQKINAPFDIVVEGTTPGNDPEKARETILSYLNAGATWWIETLWETDDLDLVTKRIRNGPPFG